MERPDTKAIWEANAPAWIELSRGRNAADRLRPLRRALRGVEAAQVRRFGRSVLSIVFRTPVLVLETTGRRSSRIRTTTLAYHRLDGDLVVVGGAGGQRRVPDWVANLRARTQATVVVDGERTEVEAEELAGEERQRVWAVLRDVWPRIETYERRAGRPVPVIRLRSAGRRGEPLPDDLEG